MERKEKQLRAETAARQQLELQLDRLANQVFSFYLFIVSSLFSNWGIHFQKWKETWNKTIKRIWPGRRAENVKAWPFCPKVGINGKNDALGVTTLSGQGSVGFWILVGSILGGHKNTQLQNANTKTKYEQIHNHINTKYKYFFPPERAVLIPLWPPQNRGGPTGSPWELCISNRSGCATLER